jgi:integrase
MARAPFFANYPQNPHQASGQARIKVMGRHHYLGKHSSPESHVRYEQLREEWKAGRLHHDERHELTVGDVLARWWVHAREHYKDRDGQPREELTNFRFSLGPLARLHSRTPARDFGPRALKEVVAAMVSGSWMTKEESVKARQYGHGRGWARTTVNRSLARVKLLFRWAESEELVIAGKLHALETVRGLEADELGCREPDDTAPVPEAGLALTLPCMNYVVRAVCELLLLTGARPKEIRDLRPADVRTDGKIEAARGYFVELGSGVWAVPLARHKTAKKKVRRVLLLGPRAQAVLRPFLERDPDAYCFSPAEAVAELGRQRRAARKSRVQPSQEYRRKDSPARQAGVCYTRKALERSVKYACKKAGVAPWRPGALRHNAATRIVEEHGLEMARLILGHTKSEMTLRYALMDFRRGAEFQAEAG